MCDRGLLICETTGNDDILPLLECALVTRLTVTAEGEVILRADVLRHLGVAPGAAIELDLLPDGRAELRAERPKAKWRALSGVLEGKTNGARLTVEDIGEATAKAWARAGAAEK